MRIRFRVKGVSRVFRARVILDSWWVPPGYSGITIGNTIHLAQAHLDNPKASHLLKHECVHVIQWETQGKVGFLAKYVWSWARNWFVYKEIDHEKEARERANQIEILTCE